jgi:predicted enzyme related to lactoylglutathione lyase
MGRPRWFRDGFVARSGHAIMLCQGAQGQPGTWIWIGVDDIDPLFAEYRTKGAQFLQVPTDRPWAYEMQLLDPDGHVLRFGSEPRVLVRNWDGGATCGAFGYWPH